MRPRILSSQSGMGLLQVIVAIGLASVLVVAIMDMMMNSLKHEATLKQLLQARELAGELQEIAKDEKCGLANLIAGEIDVTDPSWSDRALYVMDQGLTGKWGAFRSGQIYGSLTIESMFIGPYQNRSIDKAEYFALDTSDPKNFVNARLIKASLRINLEAKGFAKAPLYIPVYLALNPTFDKIVDCKTENQSKYIAEACASLGGKFDDTAQRCELPCPAGTRSIDGKCVAGGEGDDIFCASNEHCDVAGKYRL